MHQFIEISRIYLGICALENKINSNISMSIVNSKILVGCLNARRVLLPQNASHMFYMALRALWMVNARIKKWSVFLTKIIWEAISEAVFSPGFFLPKIYACRTLANPEGIAIYRL